ncbi:hypothetical protein H6G89_01795 [Oscillatoria sp. FACHB-1407]|uniref:hypothetical protein n=1 Tax=Oscillatoria sp. FACHB-1407 TaxID=2692847 RepID=UPI0016836F5C|nr:hypothetical protein [Oscillatoria sp. FACHB-1407]MBD2459765.1 hypothetical protein [Oscillatoria sp. FACHB-1407]
MSRFISKLWIKSLRRAIATAFLAMTVLVSTVLGVMSYEQPAFAESVTPEARSYQVDQGAKPTRTYSEPDRVRVEADGDNAGGLLENVREKLNLDQPLPESTKDFFKQIKGEDVEIEEPRPSGKGGAAQDY